jgi:hypothetical protein
MIWLAYFAQKVKEFAFVEFETHASALRAIREGSSFVDKLHACPPDNRLRVSWSKRALANAAQAPAL